MSSQSLQQPGHTRSDERKIAVAYECPSVGREVEFSWTESDDETFQAAGGTLVRCACSHRGVAGCPVSFATANEVLEWSRCPRIQRLRSRLKQLSTAGGLV